MTSVFSFDEALASRRQPGVHASMQIDPRGDSLHLRKHKTMQLRNAAGWTVKALAGMVWITQDYDTRDIVLQPGESFVIDRDGGTLLYSLEDAQVCIARKPGLLSLQAERAAGLSLRLPSLRALLA